LEIPEYSILLLLGTASFFAGFVHLGTIGYFPGIALLTMGLWQMGRRNRNPEKPGGA
jgi:hypothetical protein